MYIYEIGYWNGKHDKIYNLKEGRDVLVFAYDDKEEQTLNRGEEDLKRIFASHMNEVSVSGMSVEVPSKKIGQIIIFLRDHHSIKTVSWIDLIEIAKREMISNAN